MGGTERSGIPAIGIDLGTTYSCVGYWKNDRVEIIPNEQGNRTTPSYVAFTDKERLIGDSAFNQIAFNPVNTVFDGKRLIGRKYSDESVQSDTKLWPFKVVSGTKERPMISVTFKGKSKEFASEEISAMVLMKMKQISEAYIGSKVKDAVVTVPAYFNQSQRQATLDAGEIAGLIGMCIINEPTAAAIAYGFENSASFTKKKRNVLVFDLGGGTFDVSILAIENCNFEVKATAGDAHLGGEDFDNRMVKFCIEEFKKKHNKDMSENPRAIRRLKMACEKAKRVLSFASETRIELDALFEGVDFSENITQADFEEMNSDLFNKCMEIVETCLADSHVNKDAIDDVVLVGGSSRIPTVQQMLRDLFGGKQVSSCIYQDEAVAYGAAVEAAYLINHSNEKVRNLVLIEVTPLSLGFENEGELVHEGEPVHVLIPRNTIIPTTRVQRCIICRDNQTIKVFEGELATAADNKLLSEFEVEVVDPRGYVMIYVCFVLRDNGILKVSKHEIGGKEESISVTNGQLSRDEISRMIREAKKYKRKDKKHREEMSAKLSFLRYARALRDGTKKQQEMLMKLEKAIDNTAFQWWHAMEEHEKEAFAEFWEYQMKAEEQKRLLERLLE